MILLSASFDEPYKTCYDHAIVIGVTHFSAVQEKFDFWEKSNFWGNCGTFLLSTFEFW